MIARAHALLWSLLRRCSAICEHVEQKTSLLAHLETMVSCLSGRSRRFPDSLPANCGALAPFRLSSHSQPQSSPWGLSYEAQASAPSPHAPWWVSRQASQPSECWSALILCVGVSTLPSTPLLLHYPLRLRSSPSSPTVRGLASVWKLFLLHSSLPEVQIPSQFLCLLFFSFFFCPTLVSGAFLAFMEVWGLLPAFNRCSVEILPHIDVFLMYLWRGRQSPGLTPPPSWRSPLLLILN